MSASLCAPPSMFSAKPGERLSQQHPKPGRPVGRFEFDPAVPSLGLTVDSTRGPVDLVAVERVLAGIAAPLTRADLGYLYAHLDQASAPLDVVAAALGVRLDSVKRELERHRATRAATLAGGVR